MKIVMPIFLSYLLIVLTYVFAFLGTIAGLLLGDKVYKKKIKENKRLLTITIIFLAISYGANIVKDILDEKTTFESSLGPHGEIAQKATPTDFEIELNEAAYERKKEAEDYFKAAEYDFEAWRYMDAARNYQKSVDIIPTMSGYLNLGLSLLYISDIQQAKDAFVSGLKIAKNKRTQNKRDLIFEGTFIGNIGLIYINQGNLEDALKYSKQALEIYNITDNPKGQANALISIGSIYVEQGKLNEAQASYSKALKINKQIEDPEIYISILLNTGVFYIKQGKPDEALELYNEALKINEQIGDPEIQANAILNIGIINDYQGNLEEALNYSRSALEIYNKTNNKIGQANALLFIGSVYNNQRKPEDSLNYSRTALDIYNKTGYLIGEAKALSIIGVVYANQGKKQSAFEALNQARAIYQRIGATIELREVEERLKRLNATIKIS